MCIHKLKCFFFFFNQAALVDTAEVIERKCPWTGTTITTKALLETEMNLHQLATPASLAVLRLVGSFFFFFLRLFFFTPPNTHRRTLCENSSATHLQRTH